MCRNYVLGIGSDRWGWALDPTDVFTVSSTRYHIDNIWLNSNGLPTRWNKQLPIKVNLFIWRLLLNRLPTRDNLVARHINIPSSLCPVCRKEVESVLHLFLRCDFTDQVWLRYKSLNG